MEGQAWLLLTPLKVFNFLWVQWKTHYFPRSSSPKIAINQGPSRSIYLLGSVDTIATLKREPEETMDPGHWFTTGRDPMDTTKRPVVSTPNDGDVHAQTAKSNQASKRLPCLGVRVCRGVCVCVCVCGLC